MNLKTESNGSVAGNESTDANMDGVNPITDALIDAHLSGNLADSVPGLFRVLNLVYEQGISGLGSSTCSPIVLS